MDSSNRSVKTASKAIKGAEALILGVLILLAMICLGLVIIFSVKALYSANIDRWRLTDISGLSRQEIMENYSALMRWCWPWHTAGLAFPTLPMSKNGAQHFAECKVLFNFFTIAGATAFVIGSAMTARLHRKALSPGTGRSEALSASSCLVSAGVISLLIPVLLLLAAASDFDRMFVKFHQLFFGNDLWIFDWRTDPVILILPESYFMLCAVVICLTVLAGGIAVILMGLRLRGRIKAPQPSA